MKWGAYARKSISSLSLPGDIARRMNQEHVIDLAADIRELGDEPIHAPVFRDETGLIVSGRDRIAALLINKAATCWIRWASCTDQEAADLEVSENLFRRVDNRDELIVRRVRRIAETIAARRMRDKPAKQAELTHREGGSISQVEPSSRDVGAARARVARETNMPVATVRTIERRQAAKVLPNAELLQHITTSAAATSDDSAHVSPTMEPGHGGERAITSPPVVCPIDRIGDVVPSQEFNENAVAVLRCLDAADMALRQAQGALSPLKALSFPGSVYQRLKDALHVAGVEVRGSRPGLTCAYCYDPDRNHGRCGNPTSPICNGCFGYGYLLEHQRANVPRELFGRPAALAPNVRPVPEMTIELSDGTTLRPSDLDNEPFDDAEVVT